MSKVYVALDGTEFSTKESAMEYQESGSVFDEKTSTERKKYLILREEATKAENAVDAFQQKCNHEYVRITSHSNTGNYDPHDNCYWYTIECKCCEYRWDEDQDKCTYDFRDPKVEKVSKY